MLGTILLIVLILWIVGSLPTWPYMAGRNYGYGPSVLGLLALVLVIWLLFGGGAHHLSLR